MAAKRKKMTNREKTVRARTRKELQERGILPPDKPKLNRNCKCTTVPKTSIDLFKNRKGANPLKGNPKFEEWKKKYVKEKGLSAKVGGSGRHPGT